MTEQRTHDRNDRATHDPETVYDDRVFTQHEPEAMPAGWTCAECEPGSTPTKRTTAEDPREAIAAFAQAATEVALDVSPAEESDYLFNDFNVLAEKWDASTPRRIDLTLDDGRRYRLTTNVEQLAEDGSVIDHILRIPASEATRARMLTDRLAEKGWTIVECSCGFASATSGSDMRVGRTIREHLDPEKRAESAAWTRRHMEYMASEEARLTPLMTALNAYGLATEFEHTGGGCVAVRVTNTANEKLFAITDSESIDGGFSVGIYPNAEAWESGDLPADFGTTDRDFFDIAGVDIAGVASVDDLAANIVLALIARDALPYGTAKRGA